MKLRATLLCALVACLALPATAAGHGDPMVYAMKRYDLRVKIRVHHDEIVRVHVGARELCRRSGASGFLKFDLFPSEAIPIVGNDIFSHRVAFDDARGNGVVTLEGAVFRRSILGVFSFRNREDPSCGTRQPGDRRVIFSARLAG